MIEQNHAGILVAGMHRSGTSAVAGVLGLMGAYAGETDELISAHPTDNPTGYFERDDVKTINDEILKTLGYRWDRVAFFDPAKIDALSIEDLLNRLDELVQKLRRRNRTWLIKDPRLCLLLSQWTTKITAPVYVVAVRDPREIAASMASGPRGIFTSEFVIDLWEKYVRTLLDQLSGHRALFVSYAQLLKAPDSTCRRILEQLARVENLDLHAPDADELRAFISKDLRRSAPRAHVELAPRQQALFDWLERQCENEMDTVVEDFPNAPPPDAELAEFEAAFRYHIDHGRFLSGQESIDRLHKIEQLIAARDDERSQWMSELAAQRRQTESALHALGQTQSTLAVLEQKSEAATAALEAKVLESENRAIQSEARSNEIHRHASNLNDSVNALKNSLSWKLTAPLRWPGRLFQPKLSWDVEQKLYRFYYGLPGVSHARKRAFILWLHKHASGLTRRTMSYQLRERSKAFNEHLPTPARKKREPRMDEFRAKLLLEAMTDQPLISIAMPVYNIDPRWLNLAVDSVRRQYYPNWELCIADDASTKPETRSALDALADDDDPRIKIKRLDQNVGIAQASNAALELATGSYVGLLDHDDELTRDALLEMARVIADENPDLIYSDEDKTDETNDRRDPFFKPDYSPDYFLSNNYLCHFTVMRTDILKRIGGFRTGVDGAQDFDLFLRYSAEAKKIAHVPKVLYHWRMITGSTAATASAKPYTWESGRQALQHRLELTRESASAELGPFPNTYRIRYEIRGTPLVSILIPFRDKPELLDVCVRSILDKTDYPHFEIIGIDNQSVEPAMNDLKTSLARRDKRVRFVSFDQAFNYSAINNFGAQYAGGEHLLLLNNDTEVISSEWLRAMLEHSQRKEVGVVGAKLLYPDDTVQHAGVILDRTVVAMHPHQFLPREHPGYAARSHLLQNLSAVTFACAMTRRDVFEQLHGLNANDLPICFNDVDYCLRARELGYRVVFTPYALLRHFESKTRGMDEGAEKQARFKAEFDYMQTRHAEILARGDPYYNPNLSLGVQSGFHADPHYAEELPR